MAMRSKRKSAPASSNTSAPEILRAPILTALGAAAILLAVLAVYAPALHGDWLWDDDWYVTNQPLLRHLDGLWKFWFAPGSWIEYYPLDETLLWLEWHLFGDDTLGYHTVTVALHALNALLVWRLLARLGLRYAWLGGFIFSVHPAAVDSVAWIAETKNTLSALPCLLAMMAWIDYENRGRPRDYARALIYFTLALLAKIAVAPLPAVLLLYAWFKRHRVTARDLAVVAPFFAIAVILAAITIAASHLYPGPFGKAPDATPHLGPATHLALFGQTLGVYFTHLVWPVGLLPNYPQWTVGAPSPLAFLPCAIVAAVFVALWFRRESWGAAALLGLGSFVIFLAPFTGVVSVSYLAFTWVMDHFLYLAMIGPIGLFIAALDSIRDRVPAAWRLAVPGAATLIAALLIFPSRAYAAVFCDEATLWRYTVERNPGDWLAHENLGKAELVDQPADAERHFRAVELLRPGRAQTHLNLGRALVALNRIDEGLHEYAAALALAPDSAEIYNQQGIALIKANRAAEALAPLQRAGALRPHYAIGLQNLGIALALSGRLDEAIARFQAALALNPGDATTHVNLARALHQQGRDREASDQYRQALRLDPDNAAARAALGSPHP